MALRGAQRREASPRGHTSHEGIRIEKGCWREDCARKWRGAERTKSPLPANELGVLEKLKHACGGRLLGADDHKLRKVPIGTARAVVVAAMVATVARRGSKDRHLKERKGHNIFNFPFLGSLRRSRQIRQGEKKNAAPFG